MAASEVFFRFAGVLADAAEAPLAALKVGDGLLPVQAAGVTLASDGMGRDG